MKQLIRKILYGKTPVCEYATITTTGNTVEKVILQVDGLSIDISKCQWLLCLQPVVIGIWLSSETNIAAFSKSKKNHVHFCGADGSIKKAAAVVSITIIKKITEKDGTLFLAEVCQAGIQHINPLRALLLYKRFYKKPQWPFPAYKALVAAYSYPRKVRLVAFKEGDYFNIFPMDLLGIVPQSNHVVFGLRHTNIALQKIISAKKIVVAEIGHTHKATIYQLGKHHGSAPPSVEALPFKTIATEKFGFYIPEWTENYKEINITATLSLGSHTLLWGEVVNEKTMTSTQQHLFHIHFFHLLYLKRKGINYQPV